MIRASIGLIWYKFAKFLCRVFCRIFLRVKLEGFENVPAEGGFLLVSNHQSFLDPLFCSAFLKRKMTFMARDSLFRGRFFNALLRSVRAMPVRRGEADIGAIKEILRKLRSGEGVCLYAEGTRTSDGSIAEFKGGFGLLCKRGNAAVVPMVVEGGYECWPRDRRLFKAGSKVRVRYGEAISVEQVGGYSNEELAAFLTDRLRGMQNELREEMGKERIDYGQVKEDCS